MKKLVCYMLALLMVFAGAALAESGRIDDRLFNSAKQTLHCIDTGDYQTASALLGCVDMDTLQTVISENFVTLGYGEAQTRISVAFYYENQWYLAVPTAEPASPEVEALVLGCGTGNAFETIGHSIWGNVQGVLDMAEAVIWNEEYVPDVFVIMD